MREISSISGSQAFDRGLKLLAEIVANDGQQLTSVIAGEIGLAPSTARRLTSVLLRHHLIERIGHGYHAGGPGLVQLAASVHPHRKLIEISRPLLRTLARREGLVAHLGIYVDDMVIYLVREGGKGLFTQEGAQLEAYCTGIGKALLAQLPENELEHYLTGNFIQLTPHTLTTPEALRADIKRVRDRGYALDNREMDEQIACVAIPLGKSGDTMVALSISGTDMQLSPERAERMARKLRKIATHIEANTSVLAVRHTGRPEIE